MTPSFRRARLLSALGKSLLATLLICSLLPQSVAAQKRIALTFNDLPGREPTGYWTPREIGRMILRALGEHGIKAAGFVVQEKIEEQPMSLVVLEDWVAEGHLLGNQTYSRVDYNALSTDDFIEHVRDGQKDIRRLGRIHSFDYRFLRFPQLHYGDTERKRKAIGNRLRRAEYKIAHVTVKTSDHQFIRAYLAYEKDPTAISKIKELYLAHINESLEYAEAQTQKLFEREIPQILLLHTGIATAAFLDDLIKLLKQRGYSFITLPEALADPAYKTEENYAGPLGLTFLDRVAAERGLPFEEHQGELRRGDVESWLEN